MLLGLVKDDQFIAVYDLRPLDVKPRPVRLLFEVEVVPAKNAGQRCFSRLAGTVKGNGRIVGQTFPQNIFYGSRDHANDNCKLFYNLQRKL